MLVLPMVRKCQGNVPQEFSGIAVLRLPPRVNLRDLHDAVQTLIGGLEREDITGKLWIVQRGRIRIYQQEVEDS